MSVLGPRGFHAECALGALIIEVDPDEVWDDSKHS
jgi:hypothetical protein